MAIRDSVGRASLGLVLMFLCFEQIATHVPGTQATPCAIAAVVTLLGLFSPDWKVKVCAVGLALIFVGLSIAGYVEGRNYQEWLRQQDAIQQRK